MTVTVMPAVVANAAPPSGWHDFSTGLRQALHLVVTGNHVILDTTLRTLHLAVEATLIGVVIGVPIGCALGLGRTRSSRLLRGVANGLTRLPPVAVGVLVVLLLNEQSPWGGGPLAGLHWYTNARSAYLAQTLLAVPIVIALTASAVAAAPPGLLEQARAYGASGWKRGVLALRETRRQVMAGILVALGITITSIGAIVVAVAGNTTSVAAAGGGRISEPTTLALGAFLSIRELQPGSPTANAAGTLGYSTAAAGVAYATVLLGLFVLIAAVLTWISQRRRSWIPGLPS